MADIRQTLRELNLDLNQIEVYLSCLRLGAAKVHDISVNAKLIRTTTYGVLKSLIEIGLVSMTKKNNVTVFQAADPARLLSLLEEKTAKVKEILPELQKFQNAMPTISNTETFGGREGLKTIVNDLVAVPNEMIYIIGPFKKWIQFSSVFADIFYRKKKENNIFAKVIINKDDIKELKNKANVFGSEFRYVEAMDSIAEIFIYRDKIALVSYEENDLTGVIITNKNMAETQKRIFEQIWASAKTIT